MSNIGRKGRGAWSLCIWPQIKIFTILMKNFDTSEYNIKRERGVFVCVCLSVWVCVCVWEREKKVKEVQMLKLPHTIDTIKSDHKFTIYKQKNMTKKSIHRFLFSGFLCWQKTEKNIAFDLCPQARNNFESYYWFINFEKYGIITWPNKS